MKEIMNDKEIKKLFMALDIPAPSAGFEDHIIVNAYKTRKATAKSSYFPRFAAAAAMFLIVLSFSLLNSEKHEHEVQAAEYAQYVDDSSIVNDDDVYGNLIMASN